MIKDMITKLMEEANEEAEHKGWCDTELATKQHTATISKLSAEIAELNAGIATIDKAMAEATADREAEQAKNAQTIADAKAGEAATSQAVAVLRDFYSTAADATALVQAKKGPAEDAPETFSGAYKGDQDSSTGVLGMLEVIQSDFARLEAETTAAEAESQDVFEKYSADSSTNKAVKETDIKHLSSKQQETESALADANTDLASTKEELSAAMDYYEKLKPSCVNTGVSYEERVARRKEEVESLQEALKILSGDDIAV